MQLVRVLKQRHVLALAFGAMIGWSWVLLTGNWIGRAGTLGAALAFVGAGVAMTLIALTYAELASALPQLGGEHVWVARALGPGFAFTCTWALLLGYGSVVAFEVVALPIALTYLFPDLAQWPLWQVGESTVYASHLAIGIAAAIGLTLINLRGIASAAGIQGWVTFLIVASGLLLASGAVGTGGAQNLDPWFTDGAIGVAGVVVMVPLMFVGFDVIPQAAEEIDLPAQKIGRLVVVSVVAAVVWYAAMVLLVGWVLDDRGRTEAELATARAAVVAWNWEGAGRFMVCGGIAGILTTWNAFLVGGSRLVYVLARAGQLPAWLGQEHPGSHAPARALVALLVISCAAPWFGRPVLVWLVDAGSVGVVVAYACVAASFLRLRRVEPDLERPYRVRYGRSIGWSALVMTSVMAMLYLPWSPSALVWPQEWVICGLWAALGLALYVIAGGSRTAGSLAA